LHAGIIRERDRGLQGVVRPSSGIYLPTNHFASCGALARFSLASGRFRALAPRAY
jgi:hypothetical protein